MMRNVYLKTVQHCRNPIFYQDFCVDDTLPGRYGLVVLHLYLLMDHIGTGEKASQDLFDIFFYDMDRTMRESGVGDLAVPKRIKKMMKVFYFDLNEYQKGITPEQLKKTVYAGQKNIDQDVLEKMSQYIIKQRKELAPFHLSELNRFQFTI